MTRVSIVWAALAGITGCAMSHDVGGEATSTGSASALPSALSAQCRRELEDAADSASSLPDRLSCTGLYKNTAAREVATDVQPYEPALRLWSDGLNKARFIFLPKGTAIDASDPNGWKFPIGTRFWKEFQEPGTDIPVETRIYWKKDEGEWKQSTYEWNQNLTEATRVLRAKDVAMGNGQTHWLPGPNDCEDCHKGRRDRVLGFEQVALGLPAATGETLAKLVEDKRIKNFGGETEYHIGPDDESVDAKALGWLHMNCGVTCHNDIPTGEGMSLNMRLRMNPADLDGRPTTEFPAFKTTVGAATQTPSWFGKTRVVAGSPEESWLFSLITTRTMNLKEQMPPLATYVVDPEGSEWVRQWISDLKVP